MAQVPREDRPTLEDLEGYTESRYAHDPEPDYTQFRRELALWLHDYRRDQELARSEQQGKTPLMGHGTPDDLESQRHGYDVDPENFDIRELKTRIRSLH